MYDETRSGYHPNPSLPPDERTGSGRPLALMTRGSDDLTATAVISREQADMADSSLRTVTN